MLKLNEQNIGRRWEHEGYVTMSWNTNQSVDYAEKDVLFTMTFRAQEDGNLSEVLRIGSQTHPC
jgi:hypothetical protein